MFNYGDFKDISLKKIEKNPEIFKGMIIQLVELIYDDVPDGIIFYVSDSKGKYYAINVSATENFEINVKPVSDIQVSIAPAYNEEEQPG